MPMPIAYCARQLHEMWASGVSCKEIAAALGCSLSHVTELARRHQLPRRQRPVKEIFASDPTPDEIEQRKREIRERHLAEMRAMP